MPSFLSFTSPLSFRFSVLSERIGANPLNFSRHFGRSKGELPAHRRGDIHHLNAPAVEANFFQ
jgi:hypothetical protein